jgi:hypothetical protein
LFQEEAITFREGERIQEQPELFCVDSTPNKHLGRFAGLATSTHMALPLFLDVYTF